MNDQVLSAAELDALALWESPALRDAIAGLTGNLGVEIYARQVEARLKAQSARPNETDTSATSGLVTAGAARDEARL